MRIADVGRTLFAISLGAFAVQQFIWGDFVPGRAQPWPGGIPGQFAWAWATGTFFLVASVAIGARLRAGRLAAGLTAAVILGWGFTRNLSPAFADHGLGGAWTNLGKGLALSAGALAVAATLPRDAGALPGWIRSDESLIRIGRAGLGAFMMLCGVQHFLFATFVATLVPGWIRAASFWTYFAGVALIAGGAGMNVAATARLAAALSGLMIFLWVPMLHVPRAFAAEPGAASRNEWTAVFEALACSGVAFVLAGLAPARHASRASDAIATHQARVRREPARS